ncbi:sugar lactone lactonase YvrE [Microvirga lupini]|uniref:Sugar lactone lactonase YvrE n=1 Tax=Microvirga lupini TaxID=420324 RepID=A0A7W4YVR8_9HYPH|nr:SMP-30/gluconolactonase/LRE family protein [Microvirga lupini]MBB3018111.1 sugar lactone lactonase YvrE [Microvirga lupini]
MRSVFKLPDSEKGVRFNDGKVDPYGNFLAGTLTMEGAARGKLYRIASNGRVAILKTGIAIPNAICFTPNGQSVYFADSLENCVKLYRYLPDTEQLSEPLQVLDTKALGSAPDGACVDADGNLWVTLVQNGKIAKFDAAGNVAAVFEAPVDTPSCVAFGGRTLQSLYLTSIKDTGTGRIVSSHPHGGHLFACEDPSFRGMKDYLFS